MVLKGSPSAVLPEALEHWGATLLTFEDDFEPYAVRRDAEVRKAAEAAGVGVESFVSHTLYDPRGIAAAGPKGKPPLTYNKFVSLLRAIGDPPAPVDDLPAAIPAEGWKAPPPGLTFAADSGSDGAEAAAAPSPPSFFGAPVPSLADLGYGDAPHEALFPGGETEALSRMARRLGDEPWVRGFSKPKTSPTAIGEPDTTGLSPYLKFGCLSSR